jgi:hypothetical protein
MVYRFAVDFDKTLVSDTEGILLTEHQRVYFEDRDEAVEWAELVKTVAPEYRNVKVEVLRQG